MRFVLLMLLWPCAVAADPDRVSVLIGSEHVGVNLDFNEFNPGVFLTWEGDRVDWSVGVYENSFSHTSVAVTVYAPLMRWDDGDVGVFLGAALYPETGRDQVVSVGDVIPIGGVQARHGNVFAQVIPAFGLGADAVVGFGFTFPID